jgi:hypothetical protein
MTNQSAQSVINPDWPNRWSVRATTVCDQNGTESFAEPPRMKILVLNDYGSATGGAEMITASLQGLSPLD